jgi:hypothetical protein
MALYDLYKPLRNRLRAVDLRESLVVVRRYIDRVLHGNALPNDIDMPAVYRHVDPIKLGLYAFQLEALCKEIIINSPYNPRAGETLRSWKYFANVLNKLKQLENAAYNPHLNRDRIWTEFVRIAHRQFQWQESVPSAALFMRYYKLYSSDHLFEIFLKRYGYTPEKHFLIGLTAAGHFFEHFALRAPIENEIKQIENHEIQFHFNLVSLDVDELRGILAADNQVDSNYAYRFNRLRSYPLVYSDKYGSDEYWCPIPELYLWRITDGLFYDLVQPGEFGDRFGRSFQDYVGEVLLAATAHTDLKVIPEQYYNVGRQQKATVDWILYDTDAVFVKAKTKRMAQSAKEEIETDEALHAQLEHQARHVLQLYKALIDYENGLYPSFPFIPSAEVFPVVVTLENWHLFGHEQLDHIDRRVRELLTSEAIDTSICERHPYTFCSMSEFERCAAVFSRTGIREALRGKTQSVEHRAWELGPYLAEKFPEDWGRAGFLFQGEFDKLFSELLRR